MLFALYRVLRWCSYSIQTLWSAESLPMSRSGCADEAEMIGHFRYSLKSQSFFIPQHCSMLDAQFWSSWWRLFVFSKGDRDASAICKVYIHAHALIGYGFYRSNFRRGVRLYRRRSSWTGWKCVRAFMWRSFQWRDVYVASPGSAHLKQSEVNL